MGSDLLEWDRVDVDGVSTRYAVGGDGPPLLFLHGWALGTRAYRGPLERLIRRGARVWAPALPGLGGTGDLSEDEQGIAGYARWAGRFLDAVGLDEPLMVIGHSFGGGISIGLAHAQPQRVRYLVLLNAVGGGRWDGDVVANRQLAERPLHSWAGHLIHEGIASLTDLGALRPLAAEITANLLRNPCGLWRAATIARRANLTAELAALRRHNLPVMALHADGDGVIPRAAFDALCAAIGTEGHVVTGRHAWLLTDPDSMSEVLANVVDLEVADHRERRHHTRLAALDDLLAQLSMPAPDRRRLLAGASPLWLMGEDERALAGDLALCTPPLEPDEVRAVVRPVEDSALQRLTVVAADRPGLLADTTAILAGEGMSIVTVSAVTWPQLGMALHSVTVQPEEGFPLERWTVIGERLRAERGVVGPAVRLSAPAQVTVHSGEGDRSLVTVRADDQVGLLATVCRWFAGQGLTIESLGATTTGGRAEDSFVVLGEVDGPALDAWLRSPRRRPLVRAS